LDLFNNKSLRLLEKAIDAGSLRQRVIANNIANINTPGFKKSSVAFESILKKNLNTGRIPLKYSDSRHFGAADSLDAINPTVVKENTTSMRSDGNNVDVEQEMVRLVLNTINYNADIQELNNRLNSLGVVIRGGN
jgi:flagellar basal-body rod protein FlgB